MKQINQLGLNFYYNPTEEEFNKLYKHLKHYLIKYMLSNNYYSITEDEKELLVDITIQQIWQKIHLFNPQYKFSTWIINIINRYSSQFLYKKNRTNSYIFSYEVLEHPEESKFLEGYDFIPDQTDYQDELDKLIESKLNDFQQQFIKDRIYNNMKLKELSKKYNFPEWKTKSTLYKIIDILTPMEQLSEEKKMKIEIQREKNKIYSRNYYQNKKKNNGRKNKRNN